MGKRIARLELFDFATKLIDSFIVENKGKPAEPDVHFGLFMPKELQLSFTPRASTN